MNSTNASAFLSPMATCASFFMTGAMSTAAREPFSSPISTAPTSISSRRVCDSTSAGRAERNVSWPPRALSSGRDPGIMPCGNLGPPLPNFPTQKVMSMSDSTCNVGPGLVVLFLDLKKQQEDASTSSAFAAFMKCVTSLPFKSLSASVSYSTTRSSPTPAVSMSLFSSVSASPERSVKRSTSICWSAFVPTLLLSRSTSAPASRARVSTWSDGSSEPITESRRTEFESSFPSTAMSGAWKRSASAKSLLLPLNLLVSSRVAVSKTWFSSSFSNSFAQLFCDSLPNVGIQKSSASSKAAEPRGSWTCSVRDWPAMGSSAQRRLNVAKPLPHKRRHSAPDVLPPTMAMRTSPRVRSFPTFSESMTRIDTSASSGSSRTGRATCEPNTGCRCCTTTRVAAFPFWLFVAHGASALPRATTQ
mmetsp:Transcript_120676/g.341902  ORF Transcript_120676/g.341902 Transcript_120676/m.341902 type:complete len:418 (-) Transcript_120676:318-1571(-)